MQSLLVLRRAFDQRLDLLLDQWATLHKVVQLLWLFNLASVPYMVGYGPL